MKVKKKHEMTPELIKSTLNRLDVCIAQRAILNIHPAVMQLLTVLEEEQFFIIERITHEIVQVKMNFTTINFIVLTEENVRIHEVLHWATQLLPSIAGSMIMTTTQGTMTQNEAIIRQLGARLLNY